MYNGVVCLILLTARCFLSALRFPDLQVDLVFLIAAQIRVRHEKQGVGVTARPRGHEVQHELGLLLQGQPLDGQQLVGLGVADNDPPAFFALGGEEGRDDGSGDFVFPLQLDLDVDRRAGGQAVLVADAVLELDVGVAVTEARHVGHLVVVEFGAACRGLRPPVP